VSRRGQSTRQSRSCKGDAGSRHIGLSYGQAVGRSAGHGIRRKPLGSGAQQRGWCCGASCDDGSTGRTLPIGPIARAKMTRAAIDFKRASCSGPGPARKPRKASRRSCSAARRPAPRDTASATVPGPAARPPPRPGAAAPARGCPVQAGHRHQDVRCWRGSSTTGSWSSTASAERGSKERQRLTSHSAGQYH